jgi:hypothetical protein
MPGSFQLPRRARKNPARPVSATRFTHASPVLGWNSMSAGDGIPRPYVPTGNLEPATLARFIRHDFEAAWDAMATCSRDKEVGGNFMFARQAFAYLELAARTASNGGSGYLDAFAGYLADCDPRYFTLLPGRVPSPSQRDFRLPAVRVRPANHQLLAALFDMSRHGLAHLYQQTPVDLPDGNQWMTAFTGAEPGCLMSAVDHPARRARHLGYLMTPSESRVYIVICPDVLLAGRSMCRALLAVRRSQLLVTATTASAGHAAIRRRLRVPIRLHRRRARRLP